MLQLRGILCEEFVRKRQKMLYLKTAVVESVGQTLVSVRQTIAPVGPTLAPVRQTFVPVRQILVPVKQTLVPVRQTLLPVRQTLAPLRKTLSVRKTPIDTHSSNLQSHPTRKILLDISWKISCIYVDPQPLQTTGFYVGSLYADSNWIETDSVEVIF